MNNGGVCRTAPATRVCYLTQLFQPTATVATSWWASNFLIKYTKDESPQQGLEEGQHIKSCDLDTKYISFLHVN